MKEFVRFRGISFVLAVASRQDRPSVADYSGYMTTGPTDANEPVPSRKARHSPFLKTVAGCCGILLFGIVSILAASAYITRMQIAAEVRDKVEALNIYESSKNGTLRDVGKSSLAYKDLAGVEKSYGKIVSYRLGGCFSQVFGMPCVVEVDVHRKGGDTQEQLYFEGDYCSRITAWPAGKVGDASR